jgi:hypothetical protein
MRKEFKTKLNGESFTLPFDTRGVWGKARVPVEVTINGYTWRSTVGNRGGIQYIVVNAEARRNAGVKAGDVVTIALEPDTEKREVHVPVALQKALGTTLTQKLNCLSFSHQKEFVVWYSEAKRENTRARRVEKMKDMLAAGKVISRSETRSRVVHPRTGLNLLRTEQTFLQWREAYHLGMSRRCPERPASAPFDRVSADVVLRQEPDEEEDEDEGNGKEDDDDDNENDDGYSE